MEVRNAALDQNVRFSGSLKFSTIVFTAILFIGAGAATDLNNIENIRPSGTNPINITGDLDLQGNNIDSIGSITNHYGSSCSSGNVMVHVNTDGTFDCVDATGEVQGDFVARSGDTMTGTLDMQGNNIITTANVDGVDLDNPGNAISISGSQYIIPTDAIQANELDETASYSLGWGNLAIAQTDVSSADVGLGNVRNVNLSNTAGAYVTYDATNENYNVQAGNMNWGDLAIARTDVAASDVGLGNVENIALSTAGWADMGIAQSDISVADVGAADSDLNMNGYGINSVDDIRGGTSYTDIYSSSGGRILLRSKGSSGQLGWYDDYNGRWVQEYNNGGDLDLDPAGDVHIESGGFRLPVGADAY